jgi:hypothetical protein
MRIGGTELWSRISFNVPITVYLKGLYFCTKETIDPWGIVLQKSGIIIDAKERKPGFDLSLIFATRKHLKMHV